MSALEMGHKGLVYINPFLCIFTMCEMFIIASKSLFWDNVCLFVEN